MFYTFDQSNISGHFDETLSKWVIIEANSAIEANRIAESIGIYFNGVENGIDCACCGNRWYPVSEGNAQDAPDIDGMDVETYADVYAVIIEVHFLKDKHVLKVSPEEKQC